MRTQCDPWLDAVLEDHATTFRYCRSRARLAIFREALALARATGRRAISKPDVTAAADAVALQVLETGDV